MSDFRVECLAPQRHWRVTHVDGREWRVTSITGSDYYVVNRVRQHGAQPWRSRLCRRVLDALDAVVDAVLDADPSAPRVRTHVMGIDIRP